MTISHRDLAGIDLNLLVALDALLTEKSVTRAAQQVGIGQSAMSSSLARLRKLLGDELLTRVPDGMALTPRAMALVEPTRASLRQFQSIVLRENAFDPRSVERTFTVAVPGSVEMLFGPRLFAAILRQAPGIRLTFRVFDYDTVLKDLDVDRLDLAIGLVTEGGLQHKVRPLHGFGYMCLYNDELLRVGTPISLEDYLRFPHVMTSMTGTERGAVDEALSRVGRTRRLAATTPRFMTVPFLVKEAPVVTTMVAEIAMVVADKLGLTTSPVPVAVDDFTISMLWHASYDHDPAHRWLRGIVGEVARNSAEAPTG